MVPFSPILRVLCPGRGQVAHKLSRLVGRVVALAFTQYYGRGPRCQHIVGVQQQQRQC